MNNTPLIINNFTTGKKSINVSFNGGETEKVYNIYTYKFSDNKNIYYFLDKIPQNKFDNYNLLSFNLPIGSYTIYAEFVTENYNKIRTRNTSK